MMLFNEASGVKFGPQDGLQPTPAHTSNHAENNNVAAGMVCKTIRSPQARTVLQAPWKRDIMYVEWF